ncbi:MAG: sel1 repeat family protein [Hyphomonas sp.]|nr:sel1 repeat family protein [Hyphomonas sp.]
MTKTNTHFTSRLVAILALGASFATSGCVAAGVGGATYAVKASQRGGLEADAQAGDPLAQYELGLSHCCMGPGFSTQTATEWLCRSAHQGHVPAQYELGRIYAGEVSRTPAPGQKVIRAVTAKSDPVTSLVWFRLAAEGGDSKAASRVADVESGLSASEIADADARMTDWAAMPCEYNAVFEG